MFYNTTRKRTFMTQINLNTTMEPVREATTTSFLSREATARYLWALTRLSLGWTFLWPFLDKLFGLGHETTAAHAWINGGSPSKGFLSGATGPFAGIYQSIAGAGWVNWMFMLGLLGIAVALLLGIGMRIAAIAGTILLVLMWSASLPPQNDLFMDDHIIYSLVLLGLAVIGAGNTLGLGNWWSQTSLVRRFPWLT
jgi:thiosulfate dehydrogenase [quinone] large subunit